MKRRPPGSTRTYILFPYPTSFRSPLVWSLHLGFLWLPLCLLLLGLGVLLPMLLTQTAGLHALTAGAVGGMTLAVMTRATLGHTGRALKADAATAVIYLSVAASAAIRNRKRTRLIPSH